MNSRNEKAGLLPIGEIVGAHGLGGQLKIRSYSESLSPFKPEGRLFLNIPGGRRETYTIKGVKLQAKRVLLSLKGVQDRNQAEELVGAKLFIEKKSLPKTEEGIYYWYEIVGMRVYSMQGEFFGRVDSILQTGSNDVYVVKNSEKGPDYELLIPALLSVVKSIDLEAKVMRVDLPEVV